MYWLARYRGSLRSPAEAVAAVGSGQTVFLGSGCGEPPTLVEALIAERERFRGVRLVTGLQGSKAPYARPELAPHFRLQTFVANRGVRDAIRDGSADYIPCSLSQIPRLFRDGTIHLDVAMVQVSPPDARGYCSLGVSVAYAKAGAEVAPLVIAEVNRQMPRTLGDTFLHVSDIDIAVESDRPPLEIPPPVLDDALLAIGRNAASLVQDRATVQVGVGQIAEAVWKAIADRHDLGVHSGSLPDAVVDLIESGAVTNRYKTLDRGKVVCGQLQGTRKLYDYAHDNPVFEMRQVEYTHNPLVLAQLDGLVSVNSAVQVDLRGQVNAETLGGLQVAGIGGAMDFTIGTALARGGRTVVALPATAGGGKYSRIVPRLDAGVATVPASLSDCIVTEYGVAELRGKSLRERARALIEVAAPEFREELERGIARREDQVR